MIDRERFGRWRRKEPTTIMDSRMPQMTQPTPTQPIPRSKRRVDPVLVIIWVVVTIAWANWIIGPTTQKVLLAVIVTGAGIAANRFIRPHSATTEPEPVSVPQPVPRTTNEPDTPDSASRSPSNSFRLPQPIVPSKWVARKALIPGEETRVYAEIRKHPISIIFDAVDWSGKILRSIEKLLPTWAVITAIVLLAIGVMKLPIQIIFYAFLLLMCTALFRAFVWSRDLYVITETRFIRVTGIINREVSAMGLGTNISSSTIKYIWHGQALERMGIVTPAYGGLTLDSPGQLDAAFQNLTMLPDIQNLNILVNSLCERLKPKAQDDE